MSYDSDEDVEYMCNGTLLHADAEGKQGHNHARTSTSASERGGGGIASSSSDYMTAQSISTPAVETRKRKGKIPITSIRAADGRAKHFMLAESGPYTSAHTKTRRTSMANGKDQSHARSSSSRSGYDPSMMIALLSPVGNLLTGSDHIKNILLLFFLVYYLYQLVEVPWRLYRSSIPKRDLKFVSDTKFVSDASKKQSNHAPVKGSPLAELRYLEYFYLLLTVVSPFTGAVLLKAVSRAVSGQPDSLSWFSTTLFVLAAGVRPWSHFADRLHDRNQSLVAILEDEQDETNAVAKEREAALDADLSNIKGQIIAIDYRMNEASELNSREADDLATYVETLEAELKTLRTLLLDSSRAHDRRLDALEAYVLALQRGRSNGSGDDKAMKMKTFPFLNLFWEMYTLPLTIFAAAWARAWAPNSSLERSANSRLRESNTVRPGRVSGTLETILEESTDSSVRERVPSDESDYTHVGDPRECKFSRRIKDAAVPFVAACLRPAASVVQLMYLIITFPRTVLHL